MLWRSRDAVDVALVDDPPVGVEEVEGDRRAASVEVAGAVDRGGRSAVCVPERSERVEERAGERLDAGVDRLDPDPAEVAQADLDRGQVEEVDGAVLEVGGAGGGLVPLALDEGGDDRAAGEPGPFELGERVAAGEQATDAGRPAEHLVEGERDEVGMPAGEVEPVGGDVGGGVEQDVPAVCVSLLDPVERVLDAGEVRLGRVGEQVVVLAADFGQVARQQLLVDAQIGRLARHVGRLGAAGARELADPVDRVVVVEA